MVVMLKTVVDGRYMIEEKVKEWLGQFGEHSVNCEFKEEEETGNWLIIAPKKPTAEQVKWMRTDDDSDMPPFK